MTMRDQTRKEPVLADLESLERLLMESLPQAAEQAPLSATRASVHSAIDMREETASPPSMSEQTSSNSFTPHELRPLDLSGFDLAFHSTKAAANKPEPSPEQQSFNAALKQLSRIVDAPANRHEEEAPSAQAGDYSAPYDPPSHDHANGPDAQMEMLIQQYRQDYQQAHPAYSEPVLRSAPQENGYGAQASFDMRQGFDETATAWPAQQESAPLSATRPQHTFFEEDQPREMPDGNAIQVPPLYTPSVQEPTFYAEPAPEPSPLDRAEAQLAAEAAQAAAQAGVGVARSRNIFFALAGVAVAGIASIVGMSVMAGRGKPAPTLEGGVPVIAAKTTPAKEKPENPGGIEIPDQNKQVLASRGNVETKPAQILNTAEQPVDLTQVTRQDPVRVVLPSPSQSTAPEAGNPNAPASLEPKRVNSVRLDATGEVAAPTTPPAAQEETASRSLAPASTPLPPSRPIAVAVPATPTLATIAAGSTNGATSQPQPQPAAKVESRPAAPPSSSIRPALSAPAVQPSAPAIRANAPMPLTQQANAAPAARPAAPAAASASTGGGGYAIQLASRPTEADARTASTQLRTRYSAQLDGKPVNVVSGEANGRTVYRVRASGFTQANANAACDEIKAAGGGCFVTKQ